MIKIKLFISATLNFIAGLLAAMLVSGGTVLIYNSTQSPQPFWLGNAFAIVLVSCIVVFIQTLALAELLGDEIAESGLKLSFALGAIAQITTLLITVATLYYILPTIMAFLNLSADIRMIAYFAVPLLAMTLVPVEVLILKSKLGR